MSTFTDELGRGRERTQDDHEDVLNDESLEHRISSAHSVAHARPNPGEAAAVTDVDVTTVLQTLGIQLSFVHHAGKKLNQFHVRGGQTSIPLQNGAKCTFTKSAPKADATISQLTDGWMK